MMQRVRFTCAGCRPIGVRALDLPAASPRPPLSVRQTERPRGQNRARALPPRGASRHTGSRFGFEAPNLPLGNGARGSGLEASHGN